MWLGVVEIYRNAPDGSEGISLNIDSSGKPGEGVNGRDIASEGVGEGVDSKSRRDNDKDPERERSKRGADSPFAYRKPAGAVVGQVTRGTRYEGFEGLGGSIHFEEEAVSLRFVKGSSLVNFKVAIGQYQYFGPFALRMTYGEGVEDGPSRVFRN